MIWTPHPDSIIVQAGKGVSSSMGDRTNSVDGVARFGLAEKYVLAWIKGQWSGGTNGSATLNMYSDHASDDPDMDFIEETWPSIGTGNTTRLSWRPRPDEFYRYTYEGGQEIVFEWTNPNTQNWQIEVGLALVPKLEV